MEIGPVKVPSYTLWSSEVFASRIAPLIGEVVDSPLEAECGPGLEDCQYRLYPGALLLLWTEAIGGSVPDRGVECVAAALEMLHNSSLLHDDVLDEHGIRRGQPTLLGSRGQNYAVLAGDLLLGNAMKVLTGVQPNRLPGVISRLSEAFAKMVTGQMNDEPNVWARISCAPKS
jgi:Polyprenyl synthetase